MDAPPIAYRLSPTARAWPAWQFIWDLLADGEWHRAADLAEAVVREDFQCDQPYVTNVLRWAHKQGLIERQEGVRGGRRPGQVGSGPLRKKSDPSYRRAEVD